MHDGHVTVRQNRVHNSNVVRPVRAAETTWQLRSADNSGLDSMWGSSCTTAMQRIQCEPAAQIVESNSANRLQQLASGNTYG